jgi:hypothetical protein
MTEPKGPTESSVIAEPGGSAARLAKSEANRPSDEKRGPSPFFTATPFFAVVAWKAKSYPADKKTGSVPVFSVSDPADKKTGSVPVFSQEVA